MDEMDGGEMDELDDGTARTGWAEVDWPDWPVP